jgi:hypothetical protein
MLHCLALLHVTCDGPDGLNKHPFATMSLTPADSCAHVYAPPSLAPHAQ